MKATFQSNGWIRSGLVLYWCAAGCALVAARCLAQTSSQSENKAATLIATMTLDEKIGQMVQVDMNALKDKSDIQRYGFGSMLSGGDSDPADISPTGWLNACSEYQQWALKTPLHIPLIYG